MVTTGRRRALVGLAIGGSLVLAACGRATGAVQIPAALPSVHVASALVVTYPIPPLDLEMAGLTPVAELVTPFQISSTDNGRSIMLIGAYADTARTVFVFRETPDMGLPNLRVSDEQGLISAGGSAGPVHAPGFRGDYYVTLDQGVRAGPDGIAHLTLNIAQLQIWTPAGGIVEGNWAFAVPVKVQPGQILAAPNPFRLGRWKVTVETLEITPDVVHMEALVNGASPVALEGPGIPPFVELLDSAGNPLRVIVGGAGITVPKGQLNPINYQNSRSRNQWLRPAAGTYRLRFQGSGVHFEIPIVIGP
ncbi:MAG: hypothetical protein E6I60_16360 [Chloroflexi bacterium]|nr:MAG: hypothetical protein E6I60_16360 [Chloroflexota bacterium]